MCWSGEYRSDTFPAGGIERLRGLVWSTEQGDIAETQATARLFGASVPIGSLKGHLGHTLGAAGALEAWISVCMQREGWFAPTLNLERVDERCGVVDYIRGTARRADAAYVMSNNFAFGGVNTSLVLRRWDEGAARS